MINLALAAAAMLATPVVDTTPVQRRISVFQRDFPMSHQDGKQEYRVFLRDMLNAKENLRDAYLSTCDTTCDLIKLNMDERTGASWSHGTTLPVETKISGKNVSYVFVGQKGEISFENGHGKVAISDHYIDGSEALTGEATRNAMEAEFSGDGNDWTYYPTRTEDGAKVMRLVVVWNSVEGHNFN